MSDADPDADRSDADRHDADADAAGVAGLLRGAVDSHVHSVPDVIPRRVDDLELVERAAAAGMAAVVLKCHHASTAGRAATLNRVRPGVTAVGSVTLNHAVGGLNPRAVEAALAMGARVVWMPTKDAAHHRARLGGSGGIVAVEDGKPRRELADVLKLIADADAVLATGHLAPEESRAVAHEALAAGVRRVSVTHPEWVHTAVPVAVQRELAATGRVWFERCLVSCQPDLPGRVPFATIVAQTRAVGPATTVAATDFGMPQYAPPADGMRDLIARLLAAGFAPAEVRTMTRDNPKRMLGLP